MYKNLLVTGCSSEGRGRNYAYGLNILLRSVEKFAHNIIDRVLVCDFGLKSDDIQNILKYKFVDFYSPPLEILNYYNDLNIDYFKYYGYRSYIMSEIAPEFGLNVFWLDSGACFVNDPCIIFDIIDRENIFVVRHENYTIKPWISNECISVIGATEKELMDKKIYGGINGYRTDSIYHLLFKEVYNYSRNRDCAYSDVLKGNYRQQTVLSVLCSRYNIKSQPEYKYALMNISSEDQIVLAHRCSEYCKTLLLNGFFNI